MTVSVSVTASHLSFLWTVRFTVICYEQWTFSLLTCQFILRVKIFLRTFLGEYCDGLSVFHEHLQYELFPVFPGSPSWRFADNILTSGYWDVGLPEFWVPSCICTFSNRTAVFWSPQCYCIEIIVICSVTVLFVWLVCRPSPILRLLCSYSVPKRLKAVRS